MKTRKTNSIKKPTKNNGFLSIKQQSHQLWVPPIPRKVTFKT